MNPSTSPGNAPYPDSGLDPGPDPGHKPGPRGAPWRAIAWLSALALLLAPLVAMQFTEEVSWRPGDFLVFGALLLLAGGAMELALRLIRRPRYRLLAVLAVLLAFLWVWAELAVGVFIA
jgi:hypothetical protein